MGSKNAGLLAPFAYSSGEGFMATSDAQNVDFGLEATPDVHYIANRGNRVGNGDKNLTFNGTDESIVSDFGSVTYPFDRKYPGKKQKAVSVAIKQPKQGAGTTVGPTRGMPSGGGMVGTSIHPQDAIRQIRGTVNGQSESAIQRRYIGQLGG